LGVEDLDVCVSELFLDLGPIRFDRTVNGVSEALYDVTRALVSGVVAWDLRHSHIASH
jgi:hypothetical protein